MSDAELTEHQWGQMTFIAMKIIANHLNVPMDIREKVSQILEAAPLSILENPSDEMRALLEISAYLEASVAVVEGRNKE